jgi:hypothetical protein
MVADLLHHPQGTEDCAVRTRVGSTTARFPWTHFGPIGFSQGLLLGSRHAMMRTPLPVCLRWRLCAQPPLNLLAFVPRGIVPHQQQGRLLQGDQAIAAPGQKLGRQATPGLPRGKPQWT